MSVSRRTFLGMMLAVMASGKTVRGETPARWPYERTVEPFLCHADFALDEDTVLFDDMRQLQADICSTLQLHPRDEPIHLFLFASKSTYESYVRFYFPSVPKRQALFIKSRGHAMVFAFRSADFEVDVRHECTHAVLHSALPMVPLWLDEGLAEYFEVSREQRELHHPSMSGTRWAARFGRVPKLEDLESLKDLSEFQLVHYKRAWAWTHFMIHGPDAACDELIRFLADIAAQTPPGKLSERLRRRLPDLEHQFARHFR